MKTISLELSKKLNDLGLLDNIEIEYYWIDSAETKQVKLVKKGSCSIYNHLIYKTLTLEEAIEFIPSKIKYREGNVDIYKLEILKDEYLYEVKYGNITYGETLLEAIEKMLEYLIENNLLSND